MQRLEAMRHTPNVDEIGIHLHRPEEIDRKKNLMRLFHALMICFCGIQVMVNRIQFTKITAYTKLMFIFT